MRSDHPTLPRMERLDPPFTVKAGETIWLGWEQPRASFTAHDVSVQRIDGGVCFRHHSRLSWWWLRLRRSL